ncbi:MAG: PhnD/SsuA/transferrin family substrate-binding protein [Pseudomonadota bacterium]
MIGQTCGFPFIRDLADDVTLLATPHYAAEGCLGPEYCSVIVTHRDDESAVGASPDALKQRQWKAAVNGRESMSGWVALRAVIGEPAETVLTGGHRNSAETVAQGGAEIAALDAVCWALLQRHDPDTAARLQVVAYSPRVPGLPFITRRTADPAFTADARAALGDVLADPDPSVAESRAALLMTGYSVLHVDAYRPIATLARSVRA